VRWIVTKVGRIVIKMGVNRHQSGRVVIVRIIRGWIVIYWQWIFHEDNNYNECIVPLEFILQSCIPSCEYFIILKRLFLKQPYKPFHSNHLGNTKRLLLLRVMANQTEVKLFCLSFGRTDYWLKAYLPNRVCTEKQISDVKNKVIDWKKCSILTCPNAVLIAKFKRLNELCKKLYKLISTEFIKSHSIWQYGNQVASHSKWYWKTTVFVEIFVIKIKIFNVLTD
jgi:hypothetical protein